MKIILVLITTCLFIFSCNKKQKKTYWVVDNKRNNTKDTVYFSPESKRTKDSLIIINIFPSYTEIFSLDLKKNIGTYKGLPNSGTELTILPSFLLHADSAYKIIPILLNDPNTFDNDLWYCWNDSLGLFYYKSLSWGNSVYLVGENTQNNKSIQNLKPILDTLTISK